MSCWWDLHFSVIGPETMTEELRSTLSSLKFDDDKALFHHIEIVSYIPGFIVVHASRNYHGGDAIAELIARFPELSFQGLLHSDVGYDHYTLVQGRDGEAEFQDLVIADFENRFGKPLSRDEVENRISELAGKIDQLQFERKELRDYLTRLDA
jgi:hypothetical protein